MKYKKGYNRLLAGDPYDLNLFAEVVSGNFMEKDEFQDNSDFFDETFICNDTISS